MKRRKSMIREILLTIKGIVAILLGKSTTAEHQQTNPNDPLYWDKTDWIQRKDGTWVRKKDYYSKC
jgi:hypothetical protein